MEVLVAVYLALLAVLLGGVVLYRTAQGKPLLCLLHFFLLGFIIFQLTSGTLILTLPHTGESGFSEPARTAPVYAGLVTLFLIIFAIGWKSKALTFGLQNKLGTKERVPIPTTMMVLAYGVFGLALIFRFSLAFIPILTNLALIIAYAMCAASVGLAAWAWARNWFNPVFITLFVALLCMATIVVIFQNFGRRDLTAVLIAAAWGAFHGYFKHIPVRKAFLPFAAVSGFGIITLAAYTSTRSEKTANVSITETVFRLFSADLPKGLLDMASGQESAGYAMYLIEARPESAPYQPLQSLVYAAAMPVPRQFWSDKPEPLAITLVPELGITRKSAGYNVGPGIIGHIVNDNPYLSLWLYPLLLAALLRIGDDLVSRFPDNPFVVIPAGVPLAEVTAFSRGELGLFLFRALLTAISVYLLMWLTARILRALGVRLRTAELPQGGDGAGEHEYVYLEQAEAMEYGETAALPSQGVSGRPE
jgi:hypothetical protein